MKFLVGTLCGGLMEDPELYIHQKVRRGRGCVYHNGFLCVVVCYAVARGTKTGAGAVQTETFYCVYGRRVPGQCGLQLYQ